MVAGFVVLVAVPLAAGSYQVYRDASTVAGVRPVAEQWAAAASAQIVSVTGTAAAILIEALGPAPGPTSPRWRGNSTPPATPTSRSRSRSSSAAPGAFRRRMRPGRQGAVPFRRPRPRSTALRMARTTKPSRSRLASIWTVTTTRAAVDTGEMSPKPTVANTVTVK